MATQIKFNEVLSALHSAMANEACADYGTDNEGMKWFHRTDRILVTDTIYELFQEKNQVDSDKFHGIPIFKLTEDWINFSRDSSLLSENIISSERWFVFENRYTSPTAPDDLILIPYTF